MCKWQKISKFSPIFDMVAINPLSLRDGVFTRVNNSNPDEKSVLDCVYNKRDR